MGAKLLQLTNKNIGAVAVDAYMPVGIITAVFPNAFGENYGPTYTITSSTSDTVQINRAGTYSVMYSVSATVATAGDVVISLLVNGVPVYSVTETATADGTVNLTLPYEIYVPANCCSNPISIPATIQLQNTGVAITDGSSNLIIDKEVN